LTIMIARTFLWPVGVGLALAVAGAPALAQDPPARVGRIAYLAGPVSFSSAGAADWAQAPLNRPLVAGDRLWTDAGARDEAEFGPAVARMDAGTLLTVLGAGERTTQLQVSQGRIDLHVRRLADGETVEVDTPNLAFVARQPGDYRLAVAPDGGTTDVTVLRGAGDAYGDGSALALAPGQGYRFGGQDLNNYVLLQPLPPDDFDRWAFGRDQRYERAVARRYVPQGVVGAEDLDDYGSWRSVPDYGTVWVPDRAPRDWAPYHDGHWAWVDPWGWTWIDDQPYGYAVSHYGRWIRTPDTWAWVPAPAQARPVYAPALVAFVGAVLTLGGRSDPGVGWFPLAPHEPYRPPYHASPTYITNVNVSNTVIRQTTIVNNINNIRYVNRNVPGAMVAMPAQQFAQAASTRRAALLLPPGVARAAPVLAAPQARPLPQSRVGMPPAGRLPPAPVMQRVAVTRALPPAAFAFAGAAAGAGLAAHGAHGAHGAPARPGPQLAAHGPVPPLRVLRPALGKPVVPQPARGAAAAGRPGMPLAAQPRGAMPEARDLRPGHPVAAMAGVRPDVAPGPRDGGVPRAPGGLPPVRQADVLAAAPGHPGQHPQGPDFAHGPANGARHAPPGPVVQPPVPPVQQRLAAHGMTPQPQAPGAMPRPSPHGGVPQPAEHRAPAPQPVAHAVAPQPPVHAEAARAPVVQRAAHVQPPPHASAPPHPPAPQQRPQARHPQPPAPHEPRHPPAPQPQPQQQPQPQPQQHPQAPHPQAAHPQPPAPHPQPPHEPPRPAPQPPAPHPQPAPHEPPHPAPQPPHEPPHPHPAPPAHGADKGGDHGHKHEEQGGH
jgi:hypothetical protein